MKHSTLLLPDLLESYLEEALDLARQAEAQDEVPVGALVIQNGKIIGRGFNQREQSRSPISHAEILALEDASKHLGSWRLENCAMVVTLEPCPMCLGAIQQARIEEVYYGALDPKGGAISLGYRLHEDERTHHRFRAEYRPTAECSEILSRFFRKKRQKPDILE